MTTTVTVVTPSFNGGTHIERAVASVVAQQSVDVQYVVIDGGSTDATVTVLQQWSDRIDTVVIEPDKGQADAIRKGWALATGEFVTWLNSDDCYTHARSLADLAAALDAAPDIDVVYGVRTWIADDGTFLRRDPYRPFDADVLRAVCYLPQECALIRRAAVERIGGIDPEKNVAMDYDLWLRLLDSGCHFRSLPTPTALFRVRKGQKSSVLWEGSGLAEVNALQAKHNNGVTLDDAAMARAAGEYLFGLEPDDDERTRMIPGGLWSTVDGCIAAAYANQPLDRWALPE